MTIECQNILDLKPPLIQPSETANREKTTMKKQSRKTGIATSSKKAFKPSTTAVCDSKNKKVLNMKPCPIPDLEGKAAEDFEQKINKEPTKLQKHMIQEGVNVFNQTKQHKTTNNTANTHKEIPNEC